MSILSKLRFRLAKAAKGGTSLSFVPSWVKTSFLEPSFERLSREGYQLNAAVFSCISALAFAYPEAPMIVVDRKTDKRLPDHPLQQLLLKPNPMMGGKGLALYQIIYKAIGGQTMLHKVRSGNKDSGPVIQLWPYHIGQMIPAPGELVWIDHYDYYPGNGTIGSVPTQNVIQLKWPSIDTGQPWLAMPPLKAMARSVDTDNEADRYAYAILYNDAVPRTALTIPAGTVLSDGQFERLRMQFSQKHGGDNRGNVAVVEGGAKIERIGLDLAQLAFDALRRVPETRIAADFRVPAIIAGLNAGLERSTYSNFGEARKQFTEDTLVTMWELDADELSQELAAEYSDKIRIRPDLDKVKALQEDVQKKWLRATNGWNSGLLTQNEARRLLGYEEAPEGNGYKPANAAIQPVLQGQPKSKQHKVTRQSITNKIEKAVKAYLLAEYTSAADQVTASKQRKADYTQLSLDDGDQIEIVMRKFYPLLFSKAFGDAAAETGIDIAFDLENENVQLVLDQLAKEIRNVADTTKAEVQRLVGQQAQQGWSNAELAQKITAHGEISSVSRANMIARTESAVGYNQGTLLGYEDAGIEQVNVFDGTNDDDCKAANGQVWTLNEAKASPIAHPNCQRAFSAVVN